LVTRRIYEKFWYTVLEVSDQSDETVDYQKFNNPRDSINLKPKEMLCEHYFGWRRPRDTPGSHKPLVVSSSLTLATRIPILPHFGA
jgi:hypothetical protein